MMVACTSIATLVCAILGFIALSISTGGKRWKEDIDMYKETHSFIGLWQACFESVGREAIGYPQVDEICDKDYLRPYLNEPMPWFIAVRSTMLISVLGSGIGILLYLLALITHNSKATGSKYWPSASIIFLSGISACVGLTIFTKHKHWAVQYEFAGDQFFAQYWKIQEEMVVIDGGEYVIETWFRWSYMVGWAGVFMTLCTFVLAVITDIDNLIKRQGLVGKDGSYA